MRRVEIPFPIAVPCDLRPAAPGAPLVVALHGKGEHGGVMAEHVGDLGPEVSWAFPRAPYPEERGPRGEVRIGYSWYQYTGDPDAFAESLRTSGAWLLGLIDRAVEATGADPARVFLAGFSQGGYLAGSVALTRPERFAGAALLGARFKTELVAPDGWEALRRLRLFSAHGERDRAVKPEPAARCVEELRAHGAQVEHREYPCGHRVLPEMIAAALQHFANE